MDAGTLSILNVGEGDVKISFDKDNPAEAIRAKRIIKEMLRRGYALLVEVERKVKGKKEKRFERALDFDDARCEYIIADYDPTMEEGLDDGPEIAVKERASSAAAVHPAKPRKGRRKGIPASSTRAVGIARSAGG